MPCFLLLYQCFNQAFLLRNNKIRDPVFLKLHLQCALGLFDHLLHDPPSLWQPPVATGNNTTEETVDDRWRFLCGLSPSAWLERYGLVLANKKTMMMASSSSPRKISFALFNRQVRCISLFHIPRPQKDTKMNHFLDACAWPRVAPEHTAHDSHSKLTPHHDIIIRPTTTTDKTTATTQ